MVSRRDESRAYATLSLNEASSCPHHKLHIMAASPPQDSSETTKRLARLEFNAEQEKISLSRALHDDLGGLLVAAVMDIAWAEQHLDGNPDIRKRLGRIRDNLASAIALKRDMIENLHPSLLENFGLFATLRWYHKQNCNEAALKWTEAYPENEPSLSSQAAIALFRIIQEALAMITRQPSAKSAHLGFEIAKGEICIQLRHDGDILSAEQRDEADLYSFWLIEHRVRALGGKVIVANPTDGGMTLRAEIPLHHIMMPGSS
jgi:signal transduction histidine kinase